MVIIPSIIVVVILGGSSLEPQTYDDASYVGGCDSSRATSSRVT